MFFESWDDILRVVSVGVLVLVVLQLLITWCSVRSSLVSRVVKTAPTVLLDGALRRDAMRRVRITGLVGASGDSIVN